LVISLAGCNDPGEPKTRYVTIYVSQDVEIKEVLIDLDMKKPGMVVAHPEGVKTRRRPTKPRKTVFLPPLPMDLPMLIAVLFLVVTRSKQPFFSLARLAGPTHINVARTPLPRPT
jgi:hypothetical protein